MSRNFNDGISVIILFFKCRSISGFKKNTYTNCLYYIEGSYYTFNKDCSISAVKATTTLFSSNFAGALRLELSLETFTQVNTKFDFNAIKEEAISKVKGFKPRPKKLKLEKKRA